MQQKTNEVRETKKQKNKKKNRISRVSDYLFSRKPPP